MTAITESKTPRWVRNTALARHLGTTNMTIYRWRRNPAVNFPQAAVINGIEYTDLDEVDRWMRERVVNRVATKGNAEKVKRDAGVAKRAASDAAEA